MIPMAALRDGDGGPCWSVPGATRLRLTILTQWLHQDAAAGDATPVYAVSLATAFAL
jgi:hypothetical protein